MLLTPFLTIVEDASSLSALALNRCEYWKIPYFLNIFSNNHSIQVQRACETMREYGFVQIETIECVPKTLKVRYSLFIFVVKRSGC